MSEDLWPPHALDDPESPAPQPSEPSGDGGVTVTVIIPIRDESAHVAELLARLTAALPAHPPHAVLFVADSTDDSTDDSAADSAADSTDDSAADSAADSTDHTAETAAAIEKAAADCPFPVTVLRRTSADGGLGGAVVAGIGRAASDWIVVMDADLRHPPHLVPELVGAGERTGADLVVASRRLPGGDRAGGYRGAVSRGAGLLAKGLFPRALRGIGDPMSGFFALRRTAVTAVTAAAPRPLGPGVLLELAVRCRPARPAEVPFDCEGRYAGESNSTVRDGLRFLAHLAALRSAAPLARMIGFGLIGLSGFVPNLLALWLLTRVGIHYLPAEIIANQAGVLWNFVLIEQLLFRDRRHRHWADRLGRFALLANADLLLRIPLIALFVAKLGLEALPATALALATTFVLRFVATEALVYLPRGPRAAPATRS
ncbi:glycosyltransferase [Streptomyces sp. NPDC058623]|uniref:glycosyltransferase n=1 Tax=Streptomyces sp. NPDC058623 TaxID=3346563 RepID=UPI003658BA5F